MKLKKIHHIIITIFVFAILITALIFGISFLYPEKYKENYEDIIVTDFNCSAISEINQPTQGTPSPTCESASGLCTDTISFTSTKPTKPVLTR